jgi:hypothetical protein
MEIFRGITFFDFNYSLQEFGGTVTVSSNDDKKWLAFNGRKDSRWNSSGEGTDGNAVSVVRDFEASRDIISLFVYNTNIDNIAFEYYDGSWHNIIHATNATIAKSTDGKYIYVLLDAKTSMSQVRITGSNTIIANEEKSIYEIYTFDKIGTLTYPIDPQPEIETRETVFELESAKDFVINKGEKIRFKLAIKSHVLQVDIDLLNLLFEKKNFYMWINAGLESQFVYKFSPYEFKDIFKVSVIRGRRPRLRGNKYWAGLTDSITFTEVE